MSNSKCPALSLALLMALIEIGSCLQCYHCISTGDPNCATNELEKNSINVKVCDSKDSHDFNRLYLFDILPRNMQTEIQKSPSYCHKFVLESGAVARSCLHTDVTNKNHTCDTTIENSKTSKPEQKFVTCEACDGDSCNGESKNGHHSLSLRLFASSLVITYLLYKQ